MQRLRVNAEVLIPGRGPSIEDAVLVSEGSKISWVGSRRDLPDLYTSIKSISVPVIMPGMWDCHAHFIGGTSYDAPALFGVKPALAGARVGRDVAATIDAGFTSIRELAGYGIEILPAIQDGWLKGPNIYSAASIISMTGGHDDIRDNPITLNKETCLRGGPFYVADGVDECVMAVRMQVRRGAKVIKIATTGGIGSVGSVENCQFSPLEIEAMVQEAARNDLIVAAHCHGSGGIKAAILAGCKTVEHGSLADDECIALMQKHGVIWVTTRTVAEFGSQHPELFSPEGYEKIKRVNEVAKIGYTAGINAGVKFALGTDIALSSPTIALQHGTNGREFVLAVEAGMTPLQAIEAGTANAPETLGPQAPKSGQLLEGYDADFIALSENPLERIEVLQEPGKITHVWKGGAILKQPKG